MVEFMGTSYLSSSMNGTARWAAPEIFTTGERYPHRAERYLFVWKHHSTGQRFFAVVDGSLALTDRQVCSGEVPYVNLQRDVQVLLALS
jgi:hypothetical protein